MALYYIPPECLPPLVRQSDPKSSRFAYENDLKLVDLITSFLTPSVVPLSPFSTPASIEMFRQLYKVAVKFVEKNKSRDTKKANEHMMKLILDRFSSRILCWH
jgi:hypothetical protein